jgi:hypothetical protein
VRFYGLALIYLIITIFLSITLFRIRGTRVPGTALSLYRNVLHAGFKSRRSRHHTLSSVCRLLSCLAVRCSTSSSYTQILHTYGSGFFSCLGWKWKRPSRTNSNDHFLCVKCKTH